MSDAAPGTRLHRQPAVIAGIALAILAPAGATHAQEAEDPFLWLEEVEGERAMAWVLERNEETRAELRRVEGYAGFFDETMEILTSTDRIARPEIRGEHIYNFWTDAEHPRGIYRRTSWASYLSGEPAWEVVLDIDALAAAEDTPWSYSGMTCLEPEGVRCIVSLSPGGSDAAEGREFDLATGEFVADGFRLPVSKHTLAWVDENTLLVSHNLDPEHVTTSGYSSAVRLWRRGTPLEEAPILAEAQPDQMAMWLTTLTSAQGAVNLVMRYVTIFEIEYHVYRDGALLRLEVPSDAQLTLAGDQMVLRLVSDWTVNGTTHPAGSVVSADLEGWLAGARELEVVIVPDARSTIDAIAATRDYLLVNPLTDVQGRLLRFERGPDGWRHEEIEVPPMGAVGIGATSSRDNRFFFTYSSFIQPQTLYLADGEGGIEVVRQLPPQFDATGLVTEQHFATSADGTRVPYFVVRSESAAMDGSHPTLLSAYGGFQVSNTPGYLGSMGRSWVEKGGIYVQANIRGGGEYGPDWWKAALKENRQRAYDDFIAVSEDLIERGLTSPEHLGIAGGSNGGLLVGVAMTQRPDLYGAVVIQVPLLDMRRYHTLLAGASWMAEYGNPDLPEEWAYISRYSPYQNVDPQADYPTPFIFTTTRDDRVHPGHARKMAALMESQGHEVLYFENVEGGHGSGVTPEQMAETEALTMAYLWMELGGGDGPGRR